ncbi:PAS domain-containing protein [Pseudanabaena catenata USMAC16]|nr:PAS domain-containing protein [Pseudanabaena catenata]MDG3494500.1 PAS domain-containing protein [Pseudanabaena catenata USMAC16]
MKGLKRLSMRGISLQWLLLIAFAVQIFGSLGLVSYLSYRNWKKSANRLADTVKTEISNQVADKTTAYLQALDQVNKNNISALRRGVWSFDDFPSQEKQAWEQMQLNSLSPITIVGFGNPLGGHRAVELLNDGTFSVRAAPNNGGKYETFALNPDGSKAPAIQTSIDFDARQRPWFQRAVRAERATWTNVYPHIYTGELLIALAEPVYDLKNKDFLGVTYSIRSLKEISRFLQSINLPNGSIFIMERDATLVATSSRSHKPYQLSPNGKEQQLLKASDSANSQINVTAKYLRDRFSDLGNIHHAEQFELTIDGDRQLAQALPISDRNGLAWIIVVVVPESDFTSEINANLQYTFLLCVLALFISISTSLFLSRRITRSLSELTRSAQSFTENHIDLPQSPATSIKEMQILNEALLQMMLEVREADRRALDYEQSLKQQVAHKTSALVEAQRIARIGSWEFDVTTGISTWSEQQCRILGFDTDEPILSYTKFLDMLLPEDRPKLSAFIDEAIASGTPYIVEHGIIRPDGSIGYVISRGEAIQDGQGKVIKLIGTTTDISDRKQAEIALQISENKLNDILNSTTAVITRLIVRSDSHWETDYLSDGCMGICGYSAAELKADPLLWVSLIDAEDWQAIEPQIYTDIFAERSGKYIYRLRHKNGSWLWISQTNHSRWDALQNAWIVTIISTDITQQKRVEEELQRIKLRFQKIALYMPGVIYITVRRSDGSNYFEYISPRVEELNEVTVEEALRDSRVVTSQTHPDDREVFNAVVTDSIEKQSLFKHEWRIITPSGKVKWVQAISLPELTKDGDRDSLRRENGEIARYGIVIDISDRKRLEQELLYSRDLRELFFNESSDALFIVDSETTITIDCNQQAVKLFEADSKNELINFEGHLLQKKQFTPEEINNIVQDINQKGYWNLEVEYITRKGREFWGDISVKQIVFGENRFNLVRVVDITARKQTEIALSTAKSAAEEATRAKSAFLASMSHEIRTPMNGVIGMTEILEATQLTIEQKDYVKTIKDSGESLLAIINDILDFSKIESGMMTIEENEFVIEEVVRDVCKLFKNQTTDKQISLQHTIALDVPKIVIGDRARLRQVLLNLVGNAIKFTHQGQVSLSISGRLLSKPQQGSHRELAKHELKYELLVAIADTGIGIARNHLDSLFQPFTQADTSIGRKYGGTGLGLAISKLLVELMGGTIWVKSLDRIGGVPPVLWKPQTELAEQGSTFYFTIVVSIDSAVQHLQANAGQYFVDSKMAEKRPLRILLVEDNSVNQRVATLMFRRLGYQIEAIANDGLQAIQFLQNHEFDLVLMDIQMPEMDGITATKLIRTDLKSQVRIVAMTADVMPEDRQACFDAGMDDYVSKPIDIQDVIRIVSSVLDGQREAPSI